MATPHEPAVAALSLAATALRETLAADERGHTGEARAAFRRAWDALRVATALLQEGWCGAEAHAAARAPLGHSPQARTGAEPGAAPPPRVQLDRPHRFVTPAQLGLPDGYTWTELLVDDVRQAMQQSSTPPHPEQPGASDTAGTILQAVTQRLAARGAHGAPEPAAPLGQLLARYALARATALHAALLARSAQLQRQDRERAADYYRAYLYLSMHGPSRDAQASVLSRVLARYQWLAMAGIAPGSTQPASMQPGAEALAFRELGFNDSMSSGQVALRLIYFPDAGRREEVRSEWRRLAAALIEVHPQLVALIAREVAAAHAIAIEHRLPVFTWLVELLRGHDPALASTLEAAAPTRAVRPPPRPAPPVQPDVPPSQPRPASPSKEDAPRRPAEPPSQRAGVPLEMPTPTAEPQPVPAQLGNPSAAPASVRQSAAPPLRHSEPPPEEASRPAQPAQPSTLADVVSPAPASSAAEPDAAPQAPPAQPQPLDEVNRIWFHYRQGQPLRDMFFRRKRRR